MMQNAVLAYRDERILLIEIAITDKKIYIANVYAPQAEQDKIDFFCSCSTCHGQFRYNKFSNITWRL